MSSNSKRLWLVDFLRQLSIGLVLICHFDQAINHGKNLLFKTIGPAGDIGVWIFFVVSGFVIAKSTADRDGSLLHIQRRNFYIFRAARLLPLFVAVIAIGIAGSLLVPKTSVMYGYVYGSGLQSKNWLFWLAIFTCTFNWIKVIFDGVYGIQWDIFWSLAVEEQFYVLFPCATRKALSRVHIVFALLALCLIAPFGRWLFHHFVENYHSAQNSFIALDLISYGVLLHLFLEKFSAQLRTRPLISHLLMLGGSVITAFVVVRVRHTGADIVLLPTLLGVSVLATLAGGLNISWVQKLPTALVSCGELSYGAYLLHPLVLILAGPLLVKMNWAPAFLIFCAATMLISKVSFEYFEQPMSRKIKRWLLPNRSSAMKPGKRTLVDLTSS